MHELCWAKCNKYQSVIQKLSIVMSSTPNQQPSPHLDHPPKSQSGLNLPLQQPQAKPFQPMQAEPLDAKAEDIELRYYTSLVSYQQAKSGKNNQGAKPQAPAIQIAERAGPQLNQNKRRNHYGLIPIHQRKAMNMPEDLQNFDQEDLKDEFTVPNDYKLWKVLMNPYIVDSRKIKKKKKTKAIEDKQAQEHRQEVAHTQDKGDKPAPPDPLRITSKSSAFKEPNYIPPFRFKMIPQNLTNIPSILPPPDIFNFTQSNGSGGSNVLLEESSANDRLERRKERFGFDVPVSELAKKESAPPSAFQLLIPIPKKEEEKSQSVMAQLPESIGESDGAKKEAMDEEE